MTDTAVSAAPVLIRYAKRIDDPVSAATAAELATARLDRDYLESELRLIWPYTAEVACRYSAIPAPTGGPRRRGVQ